MYVIGYRRTNEWFIYSEADARRPSSFRFPRKARNTQRKLLISLRTGQRRSTTAKKKPGMATSRASRAALGCWYRCPCVFLQIAISCNEIALKLQSLQLWQIWMPDRQTDRQIGRDWMLRILCEPDIRRTHVQSYDTARLLNQCCMPDGTWSIQLPRRASIQPSKRCLTLRLMRTIPWRRRSSSMTAGCAIIAIFASDYIGLELRLLQLLIECRASTHARLEQNRRICRHGD